MELEISKISRKTTVILNAFPECVTHAAENVIRALLQQKAVNAHSKELCSLVTIDYLYALARNFEFIGARALNDILSGYLSQKFQISIKEINELMKALSGALNEIGVRIKQEENCSNFIDHLVIETMTGWIHEETIFSIGLGTNLVKRIYSLNMRHDVDVEFISPLEQMLLSSLDKLNDFSRGVRWKLDLIKLNNIRELPDSIQLDESRYSNQR